jgi:hypothetical protein
LEKSFKRNDEAAMRRLGQWMFNGLTVLSLVLCVLVSIFWATCGKWGEIRWLYHGTRYSFYIYRSNIGFVIYPHWPYTQKQPDWAFPASGGIIFPALTTVFCLAMPALLKWSGSVALPARKREAIRGGGALFLGIAGSAWFVFCWLPGMVDDPMHWIAGSVGIAVQVLLLWLGSRQIVGLLLKPRDLGFCRKCGYDLRATPDRCPECGKVVEKVAQAK